MASACLTELRVKPHCSVPVTSLNGTAKVPGDKSISHRALMFGALAVGRSTVTGLLEGADVLHTADALRAYGARIERVEGAAGAEWRIDGVGVGGLSEPADVIDMGNSGTAVRLLMGLAATHPFTTFFTGDASLRRRPMARVTDPLKRMGASFVARQGGRLPLAVTGSESPLAIEYTLPVASAQLKSAILLAGLNARYDTTVIEPEPTRDHTENFLRAFGAKVKIEAHGKGRVVTVTGHPELKPNDVVVPGDPSSAAFPIVAACLVPGADVTVEDVGINPLRTGLFDTLREMGADIQFLNRREAGGEPVADIRVRHRGLKGVVVPPERAPSMIDEYPILSVAAAFAEGRTEMRGIQELRVKESDRIAAMARGLKACGVVVEEAADGMIVSGGAPQGDASVATEMDHRIAMSFLVMGLAAKQPVTVDDATMIDTSFPAFIPLMNALGARIAAA
jgi:3-phosphoshikimate 1-carboxyvinyltransferase